MTAVVKDVALRPADEIASVQTDTLTMFERFARDPSVDVDKLDRLMQMHERASARMAEEAFNAAMTAAQRDMRSIATDSYNPQTRSRYASYAALDAALRPIYTQHGFGLSFDTGEAPELMVRVQCYVTHTGGHGRTYHADIPADGKGAKGGDVMTRTHAVGAAMSYGMRYLLKMIFNVAVGEADEDGNGASRHPNAPAPPTGYADWLTRWRDAARDGIATASAFFRESPQEHVDYMRQYDKGQGETIKALAREAAKAQKGGRP